MGGNVEAYYEAQAEADAERRAVKKVLDSYGRSELADGELLLVERRKATPRFVVGNKSKTLLATDRMYRQEVVDLLKTLGHKVRVVVVEAEA